MQTKATHNAALSFSLSASSPPRFARSVVLNPSMGTAAVLGEHIVYLLSLASLDPLSYSSIATLHKNANVFDPAAKTRDFVFPDCIPPSFLKSTPYYYR